MTNRYYVPGLSIEGGIIDLPPAEAAHANRVMRVKPGDEIVLFDGKNRQSRAVVIGQSKRDCQCEFEPPQTVDREPNIDVTIATALPKGDRCKFLIERLTELGVNTIVPLHADRTQGKRKDGSNDKLVRIAIESCKQSGRNQLPNISETRLATELFQDATEDKCWIAHPGNQPESFPFPNPLPKHQRVQIAIGPEGGFTDPEIKTALTQGYQQVGLGSRVYRIETAAIVMATLAIHTPPPQTSVKSKTS